MNNLRLQSFKSSSVAWAAAIALVLSMLVPALVARPVEAAQMGDRSILMSSSADGSTTAGQTVTYQVAINYILTTNVASVQIEFCDNSPIIGASCTNLFTDETFDTNHDGALALSAQTGTETGFALDGANSAENLICIDRAAEAVTAGLSTYTFTGLDNPQDTNDTFYARITTTSAVDCGGSIIEEGGIAMSTAEQLTLTAKVQENITFCIFINGSSCGTPGAVSTMTLGDATNGILDELADYNNGDARFTLATNAKSGSVVRMLGTTLCKSSTAADCDETPDTTQTISPIGDTKAATSIGTEQFGLCVDESGGSVVPTSPYDDTNCGDDVTTGPFTGSGEFALDDDATDGSNSTYGANIASSPSASTTTTGTLNFLGNVANTTEAGIYSTVLTFVATGTY